MNLCALCHRHKPIVESHIIPKFVFKWMKQEGSGYLRRPVNPNIRQQDGIKKKLLCGECEQAFGARENWFKSYVFAPYLAGERVIKYDSRLFYFVISLLWRIAIVSKRDNVGIATHAEQLLAATEQWRKFLLGNDVPADYGDIHLFLTDIGTHDNVQPVVNWSRYMASATDGTVAGRQGRCIVYAKFVRFLFFAAVVPSSMSDMRGTKIFPGTGRLVVPQGIYDEEIGQFLVHRARVSHEMFVRGISAEQSRTIGLALRNKGEAILKSDSAAVAMADYSAIIDPFPHCGRKIGRNELCPCGSGKKYKHCHGNEW